MNNRRRLGITSSTFILITLACIFIVFGLCILLVTSVVGGSGERVESTQRRLIYATNPALLMDACRQIAQENAFSIEPISVDAASSSLPAIIRKVKPRIITIDHNTVTLECGSNVYRFGLAVELTAIPTTTTTMPTTLPDPPMATRQLAPGVWYYAEDRAVPPP